MKQASTRNKRGERSVASMLLVSLLAACGGGEGSSPSSETATANAVSTPVATSSQGATAELLLPIQPPAPAAAISTSTTGTVALPALPNATSTTGTITIPGTATASGQANALPPSAPSPNPAPIPGPVGLPGLTPMPTPIAPVEAPAAVGATVTTVSINGTNTSTQNNVPLTFGQVFKAGDLQVNEGLVGKLSNGTKIPLQLNVKATHDDGSVRHAIISAILPTVTSSIQTVELAKTSTSSNTAGAARDISASSMSAKELLGKGFTAGVRLTVAGVVYTAAAEDEILNAQTKWLAGNVATEWIFSAPLTDSAGNTHPHLHVRYAVRYYPEAQKTRVDFTIENTWSYEPGPRNYTYDVVLTVGGQQVYTKAALTHYHHARWRKLFWIGGEPQVHIAHNTKYLLATKALPNYDQSIQISPKAITSLKTKFSGAVTEPMKNGLAIPAMQTTGGRPDIGLLPGWAVSYLLSMDKDAKAATLGTADLSGSWSHHYRDKKTGRPIDLFDYPYMTILGNKGDTKNPVTKQYEQFPACGGDCSNPNRVDTSHAPNFAYLPYIVTGDYYYLEELQFMGMYDSFSSNPGYRKNIKGYVHPDQVRGQAWSLRIIGQAGYISPDNDPLKPHFKQIIANNLEWYNTNYTNNPGDTARMGALTHGYAVVYNSKRGVAPWQDDFFTSAIGHLDELGYPNAKELLAWKSKFPVSRMTDPGMCYILAANYTLNLKDTAGVFYQDWASLYKGSIPENVTSTECGSAAMAAVLKAKVGEITGYASSSAGYPSNMQPALAYSVATGSSQATQAWNKFMKRTVLPDYQNSPQFAIVPR